MPLPWEAFIPFGRSRSILCLEIHYGEGEHYVSDSWNGLNVNV